MKIKYPHSIQQRKVSNKLFVLETIRDLDEAIDILCEAMTLEEQKDPFAEDLCPYFGILWPAAEALVAYLEKNSDWIKDKDILELGCGLGFPSLVATHFGGHVLATDFHPDVEEYFHRNCRHSDLVCNYQRFNWREDKLNSMLFDIVMGSDVLYESKHPKEVAQGLIRFLKPGGTILLTDPGRNYLQSFIHDMNAEGFHEEIETIQIHGKENFVLRFEKTIG